jgi:PIN domain nuclease of toxin-antitoxin system
VRILIDTQIFLWLFGFSKRISPNVRQLLKDPQNTIYFSAASAWEIAIKYGNGKLQLADEPKIFIPDRLKRANFNWLEINHEHTLEVAKLPQIHKDPFDRLLITQANIENLTLLSADSVFVKYAVKLIDANTY